MLSHRACKRALCATFLTVALIPLAHADTGYQPYYMSDRDSLQFARPATPTQAEARIPTVSTPTVSASTVTAPPAYEAPIVSPPPAEETTLHSILPVDDTRNSYQYNPQPVTVQSGTAIYRPRDVPLDDQNRGLQYGGLLPARQGVPAYRTAVEPEPESFDMGAGLGW